MKSIKMALLGGAALAVTAAGAQADDLEALKAQIAELNNRMAAMEAAPAIPAGYQLLTVSEGELKDIPGLEMTPGERKRAGNKATVISVLPTADAPAGTTITWGGRVATGLVYTGKSTDIRLRFSSASDAFEAPWGPSIWGDEADGIGLTVRPGVLGALGFVTVPSLQDVVEDGFELATEDFYDQFSEDGRYSSSDDDDDLDVYARSRLRVTGTTDTAVGEVGVTMEFRADFDGRDSDVNDSDYSSGVYINEAWGWWSMTPELTFGGGYTGTLADIGYGYDGACSCYFTDNADVAFGTGDTTQMRLSYASGPFSMAVALEDASQTFTPPGAQLDGDRLGVAGEVKYTGDTFSGEIAGGWWDVDEDDFFDVETQWQIGAGVGFALGEMFNISIAAAMGEGPTTSNSEQGAVTDVALPINNKYWGVNALANIGLTDGIHAEIAGGYKVREGDDFDVCSGDLINGGYCDNWAMDGFEYETWAVMGGLYYTPVDQLTIGLEGEWFTSSVDWKGTETGWDCDNGDLDECNGDGGDTVDLGIDRDTFVAAFVGVWRF
jgi:hypothetical protein